MKIIITLFLLITLGLQKLFSQDLNSDTVLVHTFTDAFELIVSEDESRLAVTIDNNKLEIFQIDPMVLLKAVKVTRNTWLNKGFFHNENRFLYFDYGMQAKVKYRQLEISTGTQKKIDCVETPKGCSYKSIKFCDSKVPVLKLTAKKLLFKKKGIDIEVYRIP